MVARRRCRGLPAVARDVAAASATPGRSGPSPARHRRPGPPGGRRPGRPGDRGRRRGAGRAAGQPGLHTAATDLLAARDNGAGQPGDDSRPVPNDASVTYTVTVSSFLAAGGDGFTVLREGTNRVVGPVDLDALVDDVASLPTPVTSQIEGRIERTTTPG